MNEIPNSSAAGNSDVEAGIQADHLPDVLSRICARTRVEVEHRSTLVSLKEMIAKAQDMKDARAGLGVP